MDFTASIVLEKIQRAAALILFENLNDKMDELTPTWTADDDAFSTALGRGTVDWTPEQVPDENFHAGSVPSLIDAPIENYPNVACIAYVATPRRSSDDHGEEYAVTLAVELMVKSVNSEAEVNSRINKFSDAAHRVLLENRTLNNLVPDIGAPAGTTGDVFIRRKEKGSGDRWYWQGGALTYTLDKFITLV